MAVIAGMGAHPAGTPVDVTFPPLSATHATRTSPAPVPDGLVTTAVVAAVEFTVVLTDSRLMPVGSGGGPAAVEKDHTLSAASGLPAESLAPVVTVAAEEGAGSRSPVGWG